MITITIQTSDFNFLVLKSNDNDTCFTLSPSLPRLNHKWSDLRRQGRPLSYLSNKWRNGKVRNGKKKKLHILLDTFLTDTVERVGNITVDISPPVIVRGQIRLRDDILVRTNLPLLGSLTPADIATQLLPVGATGRKKYFYETWESVFYWGST